MKHWSSLLFIALICLIIGFLGGWVFAIRSYKKQMEKVQKEIEKMEKEQVRNMLSAFGKKPSEEQVNRFIKATKGAKNAKKKNQKSKK